MSTVLWANALLDGKVTSDQEDRYALYRHLDRLDKLCRSLGLTPLSEICDSTDMRFNLGDAELPEGMASTNDLMAREGVWLPGAEAAALLEAILAVVRERRIRFGLLRDDHDEVVRELSETLAFARDAAARGAKFNFSMVM
ncbi:MAG TPA: hypothetical protein VLH75_14375 [Longimicrobiales bacterium]|nr:hypothetical protein [Longimicrobiales bacterium]